MDFRFLAALGMTGRQKPGSRIITAIPFSLPLPARRGNTLPISPPLGERYREEVSPSLQVGYRLPVHHLVTRRNVDFLHDARPVGPESLLHLHRLEDADRVSCHHLVADLDRDST